MINEYERRQQAEERARLARGKAALTYRQYANEYLERGEKIYDVDPDEAVALWLAGMHALTCATVVEIKLDPNTGV